MAIARATFIAKARVAFKAGISQTSFIRDMKAAGLSYRHTDMLADFRSVSGIAKVEGLLRFVRKGFFPAEKNIATTTWKLPKEFMYKVYIYTRTYPGEPLDKRFISIPADAPLTTAVIEQAAYKAIEKLSPKLLENLEAIVPWTAMRREAL